MDCRQVSEESHLAAIQVEAMELDTLTPSLPELLVEMGIQYDPERLTRVLDRRRGELYARAAQVAATVGAFLATLGRDYAMGQFRSNMEVRSKELRRILYELG